MKTLLAFLIAREEGFFKAGTLPARNHNPGDLRHSPHSAHPGDPDAIGVIDSDPDGWADLERQLQLDAGKTFIAGDDKSMPWTLGVAIYAWAPPSENNSAQYLDDIIAGFAAYQPQARVWAGSPLSYCLSFPAPTESLS